MKQRILFLLLLMIGSLIHIEAQQNTIYGSSSAWKEVKVGDTMPDIPLGVVINNVTGKKRLSDFKGKLVILDFWNSGCAPCIKAFPHMSELQEKYKDKIQIFLVNHEETQAEIDQYLRRTYKDLYPANLPAIVSGQHGDNILNQIFPSKGETGYHVWIDANGVVRLRGPGHQNTYEKKIEDLLAGKPISYVSDEGVQYFGKTPLYLALSTVNRPVVQYHSIVTRFVDEIASWDGVMIREHVDSIGGTIRNSFLNRNIQELYWDAIATNERKKEQDIILNPPASRFTMDVIAKDKSRYSDAYLLKPKTDEWLRANVFSYEQIVPLNVDAATRRRYMLEDLNRYFGHLYGAEGRVEKRKIACWQIIRMPGKTTLLVPSDARFNINDLNENGKVFTQYKGLDLREVLRNIVINTKGLDNSMPLIDATEYEGNVAIKVPKEINSIEGLRAALAPYGLDVVKGEQEMSILVIQEKGIE